MHSYIRPKAIATGAKADLHEGFLPGEFLASEEAAIDVMASSLVIHRVPLAGKHEILWMMQRVLKPAMKLFIADYGLQRTPLMRRLFRTIEQSLDGVADTQPKADGVLPELVKAAGFAEVQEVRVIPTATVSISIFVPALLNALSSITFGDRAAGFRVAWPCRRDCR